MNVDYSQQLRRKQKGKGSCTCERVHTPGQDYAPRDSYRTCLPPRPDPYLSGRRCRHRDSCPSRSICLSDERHHTTRSPPFRRGCGAFIDAVVRLTVSIDVHRTGVSLAIVVRVRLVWITVVGAVVAAVAHLVAIIVVLPGVVNERAVVLFEKTESVRRSRGGRRASANARLTLSSGIPSLSSSLSQASPMPSLS